MSWLGTDDEGDLGLGFAITSRPVAAFSRFDHHSSSQRLMAAVFQRFFIFSYSYDCATVLLVSHPAPSMGCKRACRRKVTDKNGSLLAASHVSIMYHV